MNPAEPHVLPRRATDERGRLIPLTDDQVRERNEEAIRALDEMAEITDETDSPAVWADVYRGIDEARPHRKQFESQP
jgi:hypothetical protein